MKILSESFSQFLDEVITSGIHSIWVTRTENPPNKYHEDYLHCNELIYEINKNIILQTNSNKYFEIHHEHGNAQYALEVKKINIESIHESKLFFGKDVSYSKFNGLNNLNIRSIKPEIQMVIKNDCLLRSISFYSEKKFEFGMIGEDNLKTHNELDRPMFDGCWLILDERIMKMNT